MSTATAPVTMALLTINVALFIVGRGSLTGDRWLIEHLAQFNALVAQGEWWRIVTAAFLHAGVLHVGLNMYVLYLFGPALERSVGSGSFLSLYLAAAASGGAVSALLGPARAVSIGASGAIFGLFGAWFLATYRQRHTPAGRAMFGRLGFLLLLNAAVPFFASGIDWRAHLGGFVAGVVINWLWTEVVPQGEGARWLRILAAAMVGLVAVALVILL